MKRNTKFIVGVVVPGLIALLVAITRCFILCRRRGVPRQSRTERVSSINQTWTRLRGYCDYRTDNNEAKVEDVEAVYIDEEARRWRTNYGRWRSYIGASKRKDSTPQKFESRRITRAPVLDGCYRGVRHSNELLPISETQTFSALHYCLPPQLYCMPPEPPRNRGTIEAAPTPRTTTSFQSCVHKSPNQDRGGETGDSSNILVPPEVILEEHLGQEWADVRSSVYSDDPGMEILVDNKESRETWDAEYVECADIVGENSLGSIDYPEPKFKPETSAGPQRRSGTESYSEDTERFFTSLSPPMTPSDHIFNPVSWGDTSTDGINGSPIYEFSSKPYGNIELNIPSDPQILKHDNDYKSVTQIGVNPWDLELKPNPIMFPHLQLAAENNTSNIRPSSTNSQQVPIMPIIPNRSCTDIVAADPVEACSSSAQLTRSLSRDLNQTNYESSEETSSSFNLSKCSRETPFTIASSLSSTSSPKEMSVIDETKIICSDCGLPFRTAGLMNKHINRKHVRRFICTVADCTAAFHLSADLKRHRINVHKISLDDEKSWKCTNEGCSNPNLVFTRKDNYKRHLLRCAGSVG